MTKFKTVDDEIMSLLFDGRVSEARQIIDVEIEKATHYLATFKRYSTIGSATPRKTQRKTRTKRTGGNSSYRSPSSKMTDEQKADRYRVVLATARKLCKSRKGVCKVVDIVASLRQQNYDIKVIPARANIAISAMLNRAKDYKLVAKLEFKYIGRKG